MPLSITASDFKAFFSRGQFTYGTVLPDVLDGDINKAIATALRTINQGIYPDDATGNEALEWLTAHFLQLVLDETDSGGQADGIQTSRGAGGISESVAIPPWMLEGDFAMYATTSYGRRWLTLTLPYLGGAVYSVGGATQP